MKEILENTCAITSYFDDFIPNNMDPYFEMHLTFSGHSVDAYNGEYIALDHSHNIYYIHFKNNHEMYLYYLPVYESHGFWVLNDSEE